jgi:hypothetical protein
MLDPRVDMIQFVFHLPPSVNPYEAVAGKIRHEINVRINKLRAGDHANFAALLNGSSSSVGTHYPPNYRRPVPHVSQLFIHHHKSKPDQLGVFKNQVFSDEFLDL